MIKEVTLLYLKMMIKITEGKGIVIIFI